MRATNATKDRQTQSQSVLSVNKSFVLSRTQENSLVIQNNLIKITFKNHCITNIVFIVSLYNMTNLSERKYDYQHYEGWLPHNDDYFKTLKRTVPFSQGKVRVYGKLCDERRLTSMHVRYPEEGKKYKYSGTTKKVKPFTEEMEKIAKRIKRKFDIDVDM